VPVSWSRTVATPEQARASLAEAALAGPGDALDLRAAAALDDAWAVLGFQDVVPGELVLPLDLPLADLGATRRLGERLAAALRPGDLVVLSGPLGAGKTSLTQGLAAGLGVRGTVTSPTFVLARRHRGPVPLLHVDAYRLREAGARALDLADLDLEDALEEGVVVVEWGEGLVEELSPSWLAVALSRPGGDAATGAQQGGGRTARVRAYGPRWSSLPGAAAR
jgi:tRNA threonylcarbamoyladenosine biosynthesis protein TsaE